MKNIAKYLTVALALLLNFSCEDALTEEMPVQFVPKGEIVMDSAFEDLQFSGNAETQTITFTANDEWKLITTRDWVTFSYNTGSAGDHSVDIIVEKSYEDEYRESALTFVIEKLRKQIWLTQARGNVMKPEQSSYYLDERDAVEFDVNVDYNVAYDIKIEYDDYSQDWLSIDGDITSVAAPGDQTQTMTLGFNATLNETYNVRTATITFFNTELGADETFTVSQIGSIPIILDDPQIEIIPAIDGDDVDTNGYLWWNLEYEAEIGFEVTPSYAASETGTTDWVTVNTVNTYLDGDKFKIQLSVRDHSDKTTTRTATLTLRSDEHNVTKTITLIQDEYNDDMVIEITEAGTLSSLITTFMQEKNATLDADLAGSSYNRLYVVGENVALTSADLSSIFTNLSALKLIDISQTATKEIPATQFSSKATLQQIVLPETIESIGYQAFNATGLTSVVVPGSCKLIDYKAFAACLSLVDVYISNGVEEISYQTFNGCSALESVFIPNTITTWTKDSAYANKAFVFCSALTDITLEEGLTSLGVMTFLSCTALEEVYIPGSVVWDIPSSSSTDTKAFTSCSALRKVTVGEGMASMDGNLFTLCTSLETLIMPSNVPTLTGTLGSSVGTNVGTTTIYVPSDSYESYLKSTWATYSIQVLDTE
ncbi:MAG: leucine-rich repeat protein [Rikenellaceae bacterium]